MAIAKKGLRKITVNGVKYFWKLNVHLLIFPVEGKFSQLSVDVVWGVPWGVPADEYVSENRLISITPKFVSTAILDARGRGWVDGNMKLIYRDETFDLVT